jgi:hypothetical protein
MQENLQPRRNGKDGQSLPLKVQFLLTGPIPMGNIVEDAEHAFDMLHYSKLRLSPDIKIDFAYEHYMDGLRLAAEYSRAGKKLLEIGRRRGCLFAPLLVDDR